MKRVALLAFGDGIVVDATRVVLEERGWAVAVEPSVSSGDVATAAVDAVTRERGRLDLLVTGASDFRLGPIANQTVADWWSVIDTNLSRPFQIVRAAAPLLRAAQGTIVLVSSDWGVRGLAHGSAYSASTAGLIGLMRALARELAPVRVNCVAPSDLDTVDLDAYAAPGESRDDVRQRRADLAVLRRLGQPLDVASTIAFLASAEASNFTGQVLIPNGGRTRG